MRDPSSGTRGARRLLAAAAMGALLLAASGSSCTKDENVDVVVTVNVTGSFHATGSQNTYSGGAVVDLAGSVDLREIEDDNDLEEIKSVVLEAVFYRVAEPDAGAPGRTVTGTLFTVGPSTGTPQDLFAVDSSVAVNDPASAQWTSAVLQAGGVGVINAALGHLRTGGDTVLSFHVAGDSAPVDVPTDFTWEVMVRLQVVGTSRITVPSI